MKIIIVSNGPPSLEILEIIDFLIENDVQIFPKTEFELHLPSFENIIISASPFSRLPSIEELISSINLSRPLFCESLSEPIKKYTPIKSRRIICQKSVYPYIPNNQKRIHRWCQKEKKVDV